MLNMHNAHVNDLDFRSLRFLAMLLETVSITRTGQAFGLSQPAASRVTERLRRALADPLMVRGSRGYVLTQRAEALKPVVAAAQAGINAVFEPDVFNAVSATRCFRIATTDYGALTVLTNAMQRIARESVGVSLEVTPWSEDTLERLEQGTLDAALYAEAPLPQDFHFKSLFSDDYVLLIDSLHTGVVEISPEELLSRRRIVILYPNNYRLEPDDPIGDFGAPSACIAMLTPYFTSAVWNLLDTDMICALPRRIAERIIKPSSLKILPLPFQAPTFNYRLIWHDCAHRDPGHRWLRGLMGV